MEEQVSHTKVRSGSVVCSQALMPRAVTSGHLCRSTSAEKKKMKAIWFYELLIYCFVAIFALAGVIVCWNCCLQCCTSDDDLWTGDGEVKKEEKKRKEKKEKRAVQSPSGSKWQHWDVPSEEFTLIAIPDVKSCGVQTTATLERAFSVARQSPRTTFTSTQV